MNTRERARGKWRGILLQLGADEKCLTGKHGPCPFCGGNDRFRWDNDKGAGTFICSQCGAGDGFEFLKRLHGWSFKDAAAEIDKIVGGVRPEPAKRALSSEDAANMLRRLWKASEAITEGSLAWAYLAGRNVLPGRIPSCLRFAAQCPVPGGAQTPAMLALVEAPDGTAVTIHRTFLGPNGKADIATPRALMPGELCDGAAVRLYPVHGERLGIAEGIETAIAAAKRFQMPVWAAINANMLARWVPPAGVTDVVVFGDCDQKYGGQAAAYTLAHRLAVKGYTVRVSIPDEIGADWADVA